jgi:hypothetical protein
MGTYWVAMIGAYQNDQYTMPKLSTRNG